MAEIAYTLSKRGILNRGGLRQSFLRLQSGIPERRCGASCALQICNLIPVVGMLQRGRMVKVRFVQSANAPKLLPFVDQFVRGGTQVFADEIGSCGPLEYCLQHRTMCHRKGQFVDGNVKTNSLESYLGAP